MAAEGPKRGEHARTVVVTRAGYELALARAHRAAWDARNAAEHLASDTLAEEQLDRMLRELEVLLVSSLRIRPSGYRRRVLGSVTRQYPAPPGAS